MVRVRLREARFDVGEHCIAKTDRSKVVPHRAVAGNEDAGAVLTRSAVEHGRAAAGDSERADHSREPVAAIGQYVSIRPDQEVDATLLSFRRVGDAGLNPGGIDDRQVMERDRVLGQRDGTALSDFVRGAEIDGGANAERVDDIEVAVVQSIQAVRAKEPFDRTTNIG